MNTAGTCVGIIVVPCWSSGSSTFQAVADLVGALFLHLRRADSWTFVYAMRLATLVSKHFYSPPPTAPSRICAMMCPIFTTQTSCVACDMRSCVTSLCTCSRKLNPPRETRHAQSDRSANCPKFFKQIYKWSVWHFPRRRKCFQPEILEHDWLIYE